MGQIIERSQKLLADFARSPRGGSVNGQSPDPLNLIPMVIELTTRMMTNPAAIFRAQFTLWQDYVELWQNTSKRLLGHATDPMIEPARDDRRFRDPAWDDDAVFSIIKQSYLLTSRWLTEVTSEVEDLDDKTRQKLNFYTRQFVDAMAPSNFVATNPEVLRATLESGGDNLLRGLNHLLHDLEQGKGKLAIRMTDQDAFDVGENIATTPGKIVFQNELLQLIQYTPTTEKVCKRPLLIVPPWINKFYILDLQPKNSFIKYAVDQGLTVFVISWINPDEAHAKLTFEDYMLEGPLAALGAIEQATGETEVNAIGYCLGGTLLAATLAYMAAKQDKRIKAATFFTALTDFENPGDLGVFIDEEQLASMDQLMAEKGYLDGREMATTFNMLRANDLIWSFVINNYLLGKEPFPFDLLYWNSDSTRMPCAMHSFYLREFYQKNMLVKPGGVTLDGVPIDLRKVRIPVYMLSTREDHIAPWESTYAATQIFRGKTTFALAGSGHIAGVINPAGSKKYGYWLNDKLPADPKDWLETATHHEGSWWPDWTAWISKKSGAKVKARTPGAGKLEAIEDAPGSFVRVKAV
ncbi:MAG: class I poly(R)-hydroxyalkanoic acid synthase [Alphaproteobacteria bacterium]|nr:class I poly(R)-hydroxyalkanoic acid synthase [Alphaproteobacteria bacterium]